MKREPVLYLKEIGFEVVELLGKGHYGSCYHVKEGKRDYTAKVINPDFTNTFDKNYSQHTIQYSQKVVHLLKEDHILHFLGRVEGVQNRVTRFHKVQGVGTAIKNFFSGEGLCCDQEIALIKEYVPGRALREGEYLSERLGSELERVVSDVHSRGVAGFGIKRENVIMSENHNIPYLIDLGHGDVFRDRKSAKFRLAVRSDLEDLKNVIDYSRV